MIVGVRKDVQVLRRIDVLPRLAGRAVVLDLIISSRQNNTQILRLVGLYAPWNPGGDNDSDQFWSDIADICEPEPTRCASIILGDFNATLAACERYPGDHNERARPYYLAFLQRTGGLDIWSTQPQRSYQSSWTHRGTTDTQRSILDRAAIVAPGLIHGKIRTLPDFLGATDHRAILMSLTFFDNSSRLLPLAFQQPVRPPPRLQYPTTNIKEIFVNFVADTDNMLKDNPIFTNAVIDEDSFMIQYHAFTDILHTCAEKVFGRRKPSRFQPTRLLTSPSIRRINSTLKLIGSALFHNKNGILPDIRLLDTRLRQILQSQPIPTSPAEIDNVLRQARKRLCKQRYTESKVLAKQRAIEYDRHRLTSVLMGRSAKSLMPSMFDADAPLVIEDPDTGDLLADPASVKEGTIRYFSKLYDHPPPPDVPKPWLLAPEVLAVKARVLANPFRWPHPMTLAEFRSLLRRGNPRPSPGPDGWEKWCIKSLSDTALQVVLDLVNYEIVTSTIPANLRGMTLATLHKRGATTVLSNKRGVMFSNFLSNTPFAWLNWKLNEYNSLHHLIPQSQVATQQGVQGRDLISFLAQVETWSTRTKTPVYILKRDQQKGFDFLSPTGFHDGVRAYGLPQSIIDLDTSAQTDVPCRVRTAYGDTDPFIITGVTKQGGPLSPFKSAITTSLGHRWISNATEQLLFTTANHKNGERHTPVDDVIFSCSMVECMDDSLVMTPTIPSLHTTCRRLEQFQFAYGWITSWPKSEMVALNHPPDQPALDNSTLMPSIDLTDPQSNTTIFHRIPLRQDHIDFLRVHVNNPDKRFLELLEIIDNFIIPKLTRRLPITALRKLLSQILFSKIRPRLILQPIKPSQAIKLQQRLSSLVHNHLGFPFSPNKDILSLPIENHGFGFPSITRLNASAAISGLQRDLNHHLPLFSSMARLTLSDWQCSLSNCTYPLADSGLQLSFSSRSSHLIPFSFILAHGVLKEISMHIRPMDQSYITTGDISILHVAKTLPQSLPRPDTRTLQMFARNGAGNLSAWGTWSVDRPGQNTHFKVFPVANPHHPSTAIGRRWPEVRSWLCDLTIAQLSTGCSSLTIPPDDRRLAATHTIEAVLALQISPTFPKINLTDDDGQALWATDGSRVLNPRSVSSAVIGPRSALFSLAHGSATDIQHAEVFALIAACIGILSTDLTDSDDATHHHILSDHLNSIRLIEDARSRMLPPHFWLAVNARAYYRWLMELILANPSISVTHTRAHTDSKSIESQLNGIADHFAVEAHRHPAYAPIAPIPTFYMNPYTAWTPTAGYIESNISDFVINTLVAETCREFKFDTHFHMPSYRFPSFSPPSYPYERAVSAYSATVQLYIRSGQLATRARLKARGLCASSACRFGCMALEDEHHIFVECPRFDRFRSGAVTDILRGTVSLLDGVPEPERAVLKMAARTFFRSDSMAWPGDGQSRYWTGLLPPLHRLWPSSSLPPGQRERLMTSLHRSWHTVCIRLTGRIWGDVQRFFSSSS